MSTAHKTRVHVSEQLNAPADRVWADISPFDGVRRLGAIQDLKIKGEGVGAERTVTLADGGTVVERLDAFDPNNRSFTYSIVGECPLPVRDYSATVTVSEQGTNAARVDWMSSFRPHGAPEDEVVAFLEGLYRQLIDVTRKAVGG